MSLSSRSNAETAGVATSGADQMEVTLRSASGVRARPLGKSSGQESRLTRRARALLVARGVFEFLDDLQLAPELRAQLSSEFVQLQQLIYALDELGENVWNVTGADLDRSWLPIESFARCIGSDAVRKGLAGVRRYQSIEAGMRRGRPVAAIPIGEFYQHKCCDVRLFRRRAVECAQRPSAGQQLLEAWDEFDLVGEVLDDVEDLREDALGFNGNRVLSCLRLRGVHFTIDEYTVYLRGRLASALSRSRCGAGQMDVLAHKRWRQVVALSEAALTRLSCAV